MAPSKTVRWGIMATGGIARSFVKDLLVSPKTRNVDLVHQVTAVASSSSLASAVNFISDLKISAHTYEHDYKCTAYGSYVELVKDESVDIVYIATPHSHHFQNAMLALSHGKPVLCEKALSVNAQQSAILYRTAKERNLFFMEAVWTRFFPLSVAVRQHITEGAIGEIVRVSADFSIGADVESAFDVSHRMVNLDLAGGALLDLGIYALTWVFQTMYHTLPAELREGGRARPKVVGCSMVKEPRTGADESTVVLLEFPVSSPRGTRASSAVATTAMRCADDAGRGRGDDNNNNNNNNFEVPSVRVHGETGEIQMFGPACRPMRYRLVPRDKAAAVIDRTFEFEGGCSGMMYEADGAAWALLEGKLESATMPWEESQAIMEVMDEARRLGGLKYPAAIESTTYP